MDKNATERAWTRNCDCLLIPIKTYTFLKRLLTGISSYLEFPWNIGAIASSNHPHKLDLIHDILRASAAIPIAFPPVAINVKKNGGQYAELHVDGGTGSQVFVYPASVNWRLITKKLKAQGKPMAYVIRNSFIGPDFVMEIYGLGHKLKFWVFATYMQFYPLLKNTDTDQPNRKGGSFVVYCYLFVPRQT